MRWDVAVTSTASTCAFDGATTGAFTPEAEFTLWFVRTGQATLYERPFRVDRTTVVRACALRDQALPSRVETATFFVLAPDEEPALPWVSMAIDPQDLVGRRGLDVRACHGPRGAGRLASRQRKDAGDRDGADQRPCRHVNIRVPHVRDSFHLPLVRLSFPAAPAFIEGAPSCRSSCRSGMRRPKTRRR